MSDEAAWRRTSKIVKGRRIAELEIREGKELMITFTNKMRLFINVDDEGTLECSIQAMTNRNDREIDRILTEEISAK